METYVILILFVTFILLFFGKGLYDNAVCRKKFKQEVRNHYGKSFQRQYKDEEMQTARRYYEHHVAPNSIDDITWNDLNMDEVFRRINHTYSSPGEEYLYWLLRTPSPEHKEKEQKILEEQIAYFQMQEDNRVQMQLIFAGIGRTGKYSLYDYLFFLKDISPKKNFHIYGKNVLLVLSIILLWFHFPIGMMSLLILVAYSMFRYMKDANEISPYLSSMNYLARLLKQASVLRKQESPIFRMEQEELGRIQKIFRRFLKDAKILASRQNGSSNPLDILMDYYRMLTHSDILRFYRMLSYVQEQVEEVDRLFETIGRMEAVIAIGSYQASLPYYCRWTMGKGIEALQGYHPLLATPVPYDIKSEDGILITGSNASGKSTFLKAIAINQILAQSIGIVCAKEYSAEPFRIYTSMALRDDLLQGESYYIVETRSIKRILDAAKQPGNRVLCVIDEVLRGTNTVERIAASTEILQSLASAGAMVIVATHDIELTYLLKDTFRNVHFTETVTKDQVTFDYALREGRSSSNNAILLLGMLGYDEMIISQAMKRADTYLRLGKWE